MTWILPVLLLAATLPPPAAPELKEGIARLDEGDFHAALAALDAAARAMGDTPANRAALVQTHLYVGLAYVQLDQPALARDRFRRALALDVRAAPDARFDARARTVFDQAKGVRPAERVQTKGGASTLPALALFAGAAGGAALVAGRGGDAPSGGPANQPPTGSFRQSPPGVPLAAVTRVTFTASGNDPEGHALAYLWDFGDGEKAEGPNVEHLFQRAGTFDLTLTLDDGRDRTVIGSRLTVNTMSGRWAMDAPGYRSETGFSLVQDGGVLQGSVEFSGGAIQGLGFLNRIDHPRSLQLVWSDPGHVFLRDRCLTTFQASLDETAGVATGNAVCDSCDVCRPQQIYPMTLRRR